MAGLLRIAFAAGLLAYPMVAEGTNQTPKCNGQVFANYDLWGPVGLPGKKWSATKWKQPIHYKIKDDTGRSIRAAELASHVQEYFEKFSASSGIQAEANPDENDLFNVIVVISDDIAKSDAEIENVVKSLIHAAIGNPSTVGDKMFDFHKKYVTMVQPKCFGSTGFNSREGIVGAIVYLQTDQGELCDIVAVSAAFGLGSARDKVFASQMSKSEVESALLGAVYELYSRGVQHGMSEQDVERLMKEACK